MESYQQHNAAAWDHAGIDLENLDKFATTISHEAYLEAAGGALRVTLASAKSVPESWFPPLRDLHVLGLACGGGQQGPVFAAHGAQVTITDLSDRQLALEHTVAMREGYDIRIVKADMSQPFPFADQEFDLLFNPVSNCYIRDLQPVWNECARVLKPGGVLMTGFVKEEHFLFEPDFVHEDVLISRHPLPFDPLTDLTEAERQCRFDAHQPLAFSHTLTEQLGGLMQAGFILTNIYEDCDGGGLFDKWMQSYVCVRAVRK